MNKLLYVIGSLEIGGAERHLVQIATTLKERGWRPEVFVLVPGGPLATCLREAGVPIHSCLLPRWFGKLRNRKLRTLVKLLLSTMSFARMLCSHRPRLVHFFLPEAYLVGATIAIFTRTRPRVMSRRSLRDYQIGHPLYARLERLLHPRMHAVCGNSKAVIEQLREEGIGAQRLRLIYNGIDVRPFGVPFDRLKRRSAIGIGSDTFVLAVVANLIPYKGHADLLEALALIQTDLPSWQLLCIGRDDGNGDELVRQAETLGLKKNIRWLGSRADVPPLLRLADVGILPSHQEGFSNAVLEGMAASLPMIVTDVGGNAEAVIDGETGYVVPARCPEVLANAILRVARDPGRIAMGVRGKARVEQHFSLPACVDAYEQLYREVLAEKH